MSLHNFPGTRAHGRALGRHGREKIELERSSANNMAKVPVNIALPSCTPACRVQDPSKAWWAMSGYTSIFQQEQARASEDDLAFLNQLIQDAGVPASERALAGFSLGLIYWLSSQREKSIKAYNRVVKMTITEAERRKCIIGSQSEQTTAGAMFDEYVAESRANLGHLNGTHLSTSGMGPLPTPPMSSSGAGHAWA